MNRLKDFLIIYWLSSSSFEMYAFHVDILYNKQVILTCFNEIQRPS